MKTLFHIFSFLRKRTNFKISLPTGLSCVHKLLLQFWVLQESRRQGY